MIFGRAYIARWTQRLLAMNALIFIALTILSGALFNPDPHSLIVLGAKDPVAIAQGQWWRYLTPLFLHIGIIHFVVNNMALRYVGTVLEQLLGARWFLLVYFFTGIIGNLSSTYLNLSLGAGASGAIFGLIGVGMSFEFVREFQRTRNRGGYVFTDSNTLESVSEKTSFRWIPGPFSSIAVLNLALAIFLNLIFSLSSANIGIDNAAHIGGLISGLACGLAFIFLNSYWPARWRAWGESLVFFLAGLCVAVGVRIVSPGHIKALYLDSIRSSLVGFGIEGIRESWMQVNRALKIDELDPQLRFERGRVYVLANEWGKAMDDLQYAAAFVPRQSFDDFKVELAAKGLSEEAEFVAELVKTRSVL